MRTFPESAQWVWSSQVKVNQQVIFRKKFFVTEIPENPELWIASDTEYVVYLNGVELGRGQYADYPHKHTFTVWSLKNQLKQHNTLVIQAYHVGDGFFTSSNPPAGVAAAIVDQTKVLLTTDSSWRACENLAWRSDFTVKRSSQSHFCSEYNAQLFPDCFAATDFDDSNWDFAVPANPVKRHCVERPIPPCKREAFLPGKLVKCGTFQRQSTRTDGRYALQMAEDSCYVTEFLPENAGDDDGIFAIYDLGGESVGFYAFTITAPAGTIVDFAHGEHLTDGQVRMAIHARNFADRYICKEGLQSYELLFNRIGARYLELHILPPAGQSVAIHNTGIYPWNYPLPATAAFRSDDFMALQLRQASEKTLRCCMHEHYEDCPWREQALYSYDSRNQALYGYYLWGNGDFVKSCYQLLADSARYRSDNLMAICAPSIGELTIPVFSQIWITVAWEYYLYTGDLSLFKDNVAMAEKLVQQSTSRYDEQYGVYRQMITPGAWNFYEWRDGLSGEIGKADDDLSLACNLYLVEMMTSYSRLLEAIGEDGTLWQKKAESLRKNINTLFYDAEKQAYATTISNGKFTGYHDHLQYLALATNVAEGKEIQLLATLQSHTLCDASFSSMPYMVNALMGISPEAREYTADTIRTQYGSMLEKGADTLWETQLGSEDFDRAGSCCHGWSCLPVYYQGAEILGVRPTKPGFTEFVVRPYADRWTNFASGEIPTPHGKIKIQWQKRNNKLLLKVDAPAGTSYRVESYPECPAEEIVC